MTSRCPICRKATDSEKSENFPFCSERCKMLDLGNWASEKYRISEPIFDESEFEGADRGENHDDDNARGHNR
ncbi:MAG TPA: DNA gyrase inhibitor YacG [Candidatus Dormibacteraeota bacterium]|nr:DNA gyrase inhibitor YacG [Candidatus Dormibacteraeota bacterium]